MKRLKSLSARKKLDALCQAGACLGRSVAEVVRDAIQRSFSDPKTAVAIWDDEPKRASFEHDSVLDEP